MEVLLNLNKGSQSLRILKKRFSFFITVFCFLSSIIFSSCSTVKLLRVEKSKTRINQTSGDNEIKSLLHFTKTFNNNVNYLKSKVTIYNLLTIIPSNNASKSQPNFAVNQNFTEMFCQLGNENAHSFSNRVSEHQIKKILQRFDEQNDQHILEDYKEAHLDKKIAIIISKTIKSFFNQRFCQAVKTVISNEGKMEFNEVHGLTSQLTIIVSIIILVKFFYLF